MTDTICAVSTAAGLGAIAVLRISGENAIQISDALFHSVRKNFRLSDAETHTAHFGRIIDEEGAVLDEVLATVFRAPNSFTGEDSVEISCHGSIFIQQELLKLLLKNGCRMAEPGEFTQRAFANGKFDLSQAESIADLIASQSRASHKLAMNQMRGGFSRELQVLRDRLLTFTSLVELELDFADHEELEFADRSQLNELAQEIDRKIDRLLASFKTGNAIKQGIPVAIVGAPNVGKSTLLNALLGEERAIVSDIQGTTRDTVEDTLILGGMLFRFIDTAGLRQTNDAIESMGIERSRQAAQKAAVIIHLQDASEPVSILSELQDINEKKIIQVYNKVDLIPTFKPAEGTIAISAKSGNIDLLRQQLVDFAAEQCDMHNTVTISNTRHYEALLRTREAILRVKDGLQMQISGEFLSMDLQDCLTALGEITGQISSQEVLNNIFSKFCIGK